MRARARQMELATGGDLLTLLTEKTRLVEAEAVRYFREIAGAVDFLHAHNIAHRDLKLENVLLTASGASKLCDFGLAHDYGEGARAPLYDVCGSKSYVAPEVLLEKGYDGCVADVWSLGVCLFAMLTGFFPFVEAAARNFYFAQAHRLVGTCGSFTLCVFGLYTTPCALSAATIALVDRHLRVEPAKRCTARAALAHAHALEATLEDHSSERAAQLGSVTCLPSLDSPTPTLDSSTDWLAPPFHESSCPSYWLDLDAAAGVPALMCC